MEAHQQSDHDIFGEKSTASHDEVLQFSKLTEEELAVEKKLRRKIDTLIMPLVILVYLMNYIDRNNYAAARLQGLEDDLHLTGEQYQTALSILFVAYILTLATLRPVDSSLDSLVWYSERFGVADDNNKTEAPFFAGVLFYLSKWYTKEELAFRMSIFYAGSLISGAFGNLIAAGILSGLAGARGYAAWQWLYIIEGSITIFIGLIICVVLPDFPDTWRALSPEMKAVANRRLAIEAAEADVDEPGGMSQLRGLKLAMLDPKTYILAIAYMSITGAAGFQNFFPTLTGTLGYGHIVSLLLVAPPYVFMVFYSFLHNWYSDKFHNRFWFFVYPIPITIVGWIVFMTTDSFGPRYFSLFLMNFVFAINGTCYGWIANAIPRPPAKRAASYAFINAIGNSASIWTPYTYRDQDKPHYVLALCVCIALQVLAFLMALLLKIILTRQNKQLDRLEDEDVQLTDREMRKLQKAAEFEGIDVATARRLQKSYRYMT
ncbi:MAG: hypothetical protein Q9227_006553 [Pyrenula ochraceoflavens]